MVKKITKSVGGKRYIVTITFLNNNFALINKAKMNFAIINCTKSLYITANHRLDLIFCV